jgi:hypothetical protein
LQDHALTTTDRIKLLLELGEDDWALPELSTVMGMLGEPAWAQIGKDHDTLFCGRTSQSDRGSKQGARRKLQQKSRIDDFEHEDQLEKKALT